MSYDKSIDINNFGEFVEDSQDIRQSWVLILSTIKGSDTILPEYGSNIFDYIDNPVSNFGGEFLAMVIQDLERWEKRCTITKVSRKIENTNIILYISGVFKKTNTPIEISINLSELRNATVIGSYSSAYNKLQYS